jgi:hypothetical protein
LPWLRCYVWDGGQVCKSDGILCYAATGGTPFSSPVSGIEAAVAHQDGRLEGWPVTEQERRSVGRGRSGHEWLGVV